MRVADPLLHISQSSSPDPRRSCSARSNRSSPPRAMSARRESHHQRFYESLVGSVPVHPAVLHRPQRECLDPGSERISAIPRVEDPEAGEVEVFEG